MLPRPAALPSIGPVLLLALFTFCWMSGFDIIYSMQDIASDRETGVHSVPASLGPAGAQVVAAGPTWSPWPRLSGSGAWWMAACFPGRLWRYRFGAFVAGYIPQIPLPARFFPVSAIASISGAMVPLIGGFR